MNDLADFTLKSIAGDEIVEVHHKLCGKYLGVVENMGEALQKSLSHRCKVRDE